MFTPDRDTMRRYFLDAWRKARGGEPLEPLEEQIAAVVRAHPEYHALLDDPYAALAKEFPPEGGESNPFLHLSLHLAVLEQVATDRPPGVRAIYRGAASSAGDPHEAEHRIMECLAEIIWETQRAGRAPDESAYLDCLRRIPGER